MTKNTIIKIRILLLIIIMVVLIILLMIGTYSCSCHINIRSLLNRLNQNEGVICAADMVLRIVAYVIKSLINEIKHHMK